MVDEARVRSPLQDWGGRFAELPDGVRVTELPFLTQLDLRVDPDGPAAAAVGVTLGAPLPFESCTSTRIGDVEMLWLGPDEWLLVTAPGRQEELTARLHGAIGAERGTVVDVSAQRAVLSLSGPAARGVLAHGCAIDFDPSVSPVGTCVQTLVARIGVTVVVREARASEFLMLVRASLADYLAAWLVDATTDL